jgi:hypothetical protein
MESGGVMAFAVLRLFVAIDFLRRRFSSIFTSPLAQLGSVFIGIGRSFAIELFGLKTPICHAKL